MKLVIDLDENVYTRLFDNGLEDYAIVTDDLFAIAKSIRNATPLTDCTDAISREEVMKLKTRIDKYGDMIYAFDVNRLPSVNPKCPSLDREQKFHCEYCPEMRDLSKIRAEITDTYNSIDDVLIKNGLSIARRIIDKYSKGGDSDA